MPRKKLIETDELPFHITNRSNNKENFYIDAPLLWDIMVKRIRYLEDHYNIRTHAFLLMNNHYHWILSTPKFQLSTGMTYFHREVARNANKHCGRINHFFGGRYKWSLIEEENYYWNCIKYVFRNPVKAGMCKQVQNYRFSSLNYQVEPKLWSMVDFFENPKLEVELDLDWLNEPFAADQDLSIQKGLRRRTFSPPCDRNRKRVEFEAARYKKGLGT